jgi:uncharacterized RDD family membrane protein YckC
MQNEITTSENEQHIFTEEDILDRQDASVGQRFLNYLIDALLMQYSLAFATTWLLVKFLLMVSPDTAYQLFGDGRDTGEVLIAFYLIAIVNYLFYYTLCEKMFRGYTLGKLITGTRAIKENGEDLTLKDAFLRSLSRLVPLEAFSAFGGHPWHDRWTETMVIKSR